MRVFPAADLQRNASEIQRAALKEPVFLSYHDKPRYVMMSLEDFVKLRGAKITADPHAMPESVMQRIRELEDAYPDAEPALAGGLAYLLEDEDKTVGFHP